MTTYTKQTIMIYKEPVDMVTPTYLNNLNIKTTEMQNAGKTDGIYEFINEWTVKRVWLDQNAADEWVQYVAGILETEDIVVTNYQISDNTAPA